MKLGTDRKKLAILGVLTGAAVYLLYSNVFSSPSESGSVQARVARPSISDAMPQPLASPRTASQRAMAASRSANTRRGSQEFRPAYKSKGGVDPTAIDPRLRLDLLAKVQAVEVGPAERNLFQFGAAAAPAVREPPKILPKPPAEIAREQAKLAPPGPPAPPPPPPITLKYYGYTAHRADGNKRAFFLDGEEIFVAAEGELVKRRYKVVRIGVNSVVVEDTQFNNTQTLPLAEESAG
jgi:hypothetical protein